MIVTRCYGKFRKLKFCLLFAKYLIFVKIQGGRTMLKKILCAGLAAALLVAVTGCGGAKDKGKPANTKAKWPKNVEVVVPYGAGGALPDPGRSRMGRKTAASSCSTTRDLP